MQTAGVTSRKACAQWVDAESKATRTVGANQGTEVPVVHIPLKGFVVPLSFPTTRLSTGKADRELVDVDLVDSFASIDERQLKERMDFEVLGYIQKHAPLLHHGQALGWPGGAQHPRPPRGLEGRCRSP